MRKLTAAQDSSLMDNLSKIHVWFARQVRRDDLKWRNIALIIISHSIAVGGLLKYWNKAKLTTYLFTFFIGGVGGFGVTAGAHRLWTHRTYKARWPLRVILLTCYAVAGQNSLFDWVRDHRVHHKYSDTDADPHNANRGFFFSHIGWLMQKKRPEVIEKGNQLDMSDLFEDPLVVVFQKYYIWIRALMCFLLPVYINSVWLGENWIISFIALDFIRYIANLNFTFLVNSAAHLYGYKPYDKRIMPGENIWVAIVAMGEGWHNYHHVFPWDYRAAELGSYSLNISTFWIDQFAKIGWAYDLKKPSEKMIQAHAHKYASHEHPVEVSEKEASTMELAMDEDKTIDDGSPKTIKESDAKTIKDIHTKAIQDLADKSNNNINGQEKVNGLSIFKDMNGVGAVKDKAA